MFSRFESFGQNKVMAAKVAAEATVAVKKAAPLCSYFSGADNGASGTLGTDGLVKSLETSDLLLANLSWKLSDF